MNSAQPLHALTFAGRQQSFSVRKSTGLEPLLVLILPLIVAGSAQAASISFSREIRPILSEHCFACHGPDEKTRKAGLRLDQEAVAKAALKTGHRAIVPGDAKASALMTRVLESDPEEIMPPPEMKKPLSALKIQVLKQWLEEGARYEGHWAYVTPKRPELP